MSTYVNVCKVLDMEIQTHQLSALMQRVSDQQIQQIVTRHRTENQEKASQPYLGIRAKLLAIQKEQEEIEEKREASKKKFLKVAKVSHMMSQMKGTIELVCTCRSLDAKCRIHD